MAAFALRVFSLCLALASAEMLHGIARVRFVIPLLGKRRAQQVSIVTGTLLAFAVCYFMVPALGVSRPGPLLGLGLFLSAFMASFDAGVGRIVMRRKWSVIAEDFDPRKGNYLLFGLICLVVIPYAVMAIAPPA